MANPSGQLDLGSNQAEISANDPRHAKVHEDLLAGINQTAKNAGVSATGDIVSPKSPDAVTVSTGDGGMHVQINHSGPKNRGIRYFTEIGFSTANNPNFGEPLIVDHGTSRTSHPIPLPEKDGAGNTYYYTVRSYAQNPGGPPSSPTIAQGGPFNVTGGQKLTLLPSTGSGTAPNTGQSAGQGLGKNQRSLS